MSEAADSSELKSLTKVQLVQLAKERGLPVSGTKAVLIARLLGNDGLPNLSQQSSQQALQPIAINQHIVEFGHDEIERDRLEQKRIRLLGKTKQELQDILRARKQKVTGKKEVLVNRLLGIEAPTKQKKIENSAAARLLKDDIYEGRDLMISNQEPLEADALYHTRTQFRRYPLDEFSKLLDSLREFHLTSKKLAEEDDRLVLKQLESIGGMAKIDKRGMTSWQFHPARKLLQEDIKNNLHLNRKPNELRLSREEYWDIPKKVFRQRIAQEVLRIKQNNYNDFLREENEDDSWADDASEWSSDGSSLASSAT